MSGKELLSEVFLVVLINYSLIDPNLHHSCIRKSLLYDSADRLKEFLWPDEASVMIRAPLKHEGQ